MPQRSSKKPRKKKPGAEDANVLASRIVEAATQEGDAKPEKNPDAVALGRRGGLKGGKARAEKLTPERRSEIALKAARARWGHKDED